MHRWLSLASLLLLPSALAAQSEAVAGAVGSITEQDMRHRIGVLAHDSMLGRNTPSPEIEETARYVAGEFRRFGLAPGGDDGKFVQRYALQRVQLDTARSSVMASNGSTWRFPTDVARVFGGYAPDGTTGPTILATGLAGDEAAFERQEIEGSVVVYVAQLGPGGNLSRQARRTLFGIYRREPAAVIVVGELPDAAWVAMGTNQLRSSVTVAWLSSTDAPVLMTRDQTIAGLLEAQGFDLQEIRDEEAESFHTWRLDGVQLEVTLRRRIIDEQSAPNVAGILEGSDPALRDEYIVFSAHMDHVGVGRAVRGDSIFNGADDNASGTAAVVELAEAFATLNPRPRRSLIFLTVSGEEKGLWGSDYFAVNPPVPIERIVANVNIDMIGRNWTDTVVVIGKEHSDLGVTLNRVAERHPELNMTPIDDIWPEENFYRRSDHYNFAKRGVPVLFFFTGTHEDYHRPSDHVENVDAEKAARITRLMFYLGLEVANAAEPPRWDPESYKEIVEGETR